MGSEYMETICLACSQNGTSCCQGTQIFLTNGDVLRIAQFLNAYNFFTTEMADAVYLDPGDDAQWLSLTIRPDGKRRVLKRTAARSCRMLGSNGCILPMSVRPLICRLHPYTYKADGISGVDPACPISREREVPAVLEQLGMAIAEARKWHELLYFELHGGTTPRVEEFDRGLCPPSDKIAA
jgi:Fe-S-cluster containining protein